MVRIFLALSALLCLFGCGSKSNNNLKVAATPVPHAQMLEFIQPDLKEQGIDLVIVTTDDYNMPNRALAEKGSRCQFFPAHSFSEPSNSKFPLTHSELRQNRNRTYGHLL